MTLPDRNNPYSFDEYLAWRDQVDFYADDNFIQQVVKRFAGADWLAVDKAAREVSPKVSWRWSKMADAIARPDKQPFIEHYDGHHHRIDRIVRPLDTVIMEKEIFGEGIFSPHKSPWEKLIKMYLIYQNGEACISCPITCTEGLITVLEKYADNEVLTRILQQCRDGIDNNYAIGAQYLSEIHGGSDVGSNLLEAVNEDGVWHLYGTKFFCSATHADYALVTAKPSGSEKVGLFIIPSWLPGNKEREQRNGYTIDRLKWKLGTSELTTAEITLDGAVAYPVGPLERGLANMVGIVLTYSRLTVGLSAAAMMTRAAREATAYAAFRQAFDQTIANFPLVTGQLTTINQTTQRTTAGAFKLYGQIMNLPGGLTGEKNDEPAEIKRRRFEVRELIMLQKMAAAWDCVDTIRLAMSILGGHGVMEDFSCLPRLYRDAAVNELWEGPRNVLLMQVYRDLKQAATWYPTDELVRNLLRGSDQVKTEELVSEITNLLSFPNILAPTPEAITIAARWDRCCHELFHLYQEVALLEVLT